jgi:cobalamin biosynthesis protein CobT
MVVVVKVMAKVMDGGGEGDGEENSDGDDDANSDNDSNADSKSNNTSKMSPNDLNKLAKAIEKQRDFLDSKSTKTGKLTKSQASTISAMREAGVESRSVSTSEDGKSNFVDTVVIKKLTPAIICSLPGLFNSNSNYFVNGQYNYDTLLASNPNDYKVRRIKPLQDAIMNGIVLGKQLGRKLQLRNADRNLKTTRLETGKIDRRLIAQLGYNNANVFHRIITDRFKNYFIHISIDASGSMSGHKFENAIASAVAVAQAASMTTGIRIQISLRGTNSLNGRNEKAVTIYAYDSALDKMSKIRNMFKYLDTFGCTPEGIAFKSIEKDIKADAKGDECIFVNYSDGAPTDISGCGYYYDGVAYTRRVITGFREIGINIISYFITEGNGYGAD